MSTQHKEEPSFHVLIATTGRSSLVYMLNSLLSQFTSRDHVTIVFDGVSEVPASLLASSREYRRFHEEGRSVAQIHVFCEPVALGFWGHGVRNKYASLLEPRTDFVMHADDDDVYVAGAFDKLRCHCATDLNRLYVAKMINDRTKERHPQSNQLRVFVGNIGTPCGIIPFKWNADSEWEYVHGGDGRFYIKLFEKYGKSAMFLSDLLLYIVRPSQQSLVPWML